MFLEHFADAARNPLWRFRAKNGAEEKALPSMVAREMHTCGSFAVTKTAYTFADGRATRVLAGDGEHIAVLIEQLTLTEPRCVYTSFSIPQDADLSCNVANKNRLVLRAGGRGAKLFRLLQTLDGTDGMEGAGLLLPDGFSDGAMRITPYSGLYGFGCRHLAVFALTEAQSDEVKGWHMESGAGIEITAPDKSCRARLFAEQDGVTFVDPLMNERITLFYNN